MKAEDIFIGKGDMKSEIVEGDIERRIHTGEHIQIVEYRFPADRTFPPHRHETVEQVGYLLSGRMGFNIGGIVRDLAPGEWYRVPVGVEHNAWTYEKPSVLLDLFSPPREELK